MSRKRKLSEEEGIRSARSRRIPKLKKWPILLLAVVLLLWLAPIIVAKTGLRHTLARWAAGNLDAAIEIESAQLNWFSPVRLRGVSVVNADDEALRDNRLNLLKNLRELFLQVADISQLVVGK